jgi:hypothetical protein
MTSTGSNVADNPPKSALSRSSDSRGASSCEWNRCSARQGAGDRNRRRIGRLLVRHGLAVDAEATDPLAAESLALATGTTFHYVTGWIRSAGRPSRCATLAG